MGKFFEIINLAVPCAFILQDGSRFDLRTGIPNSAPKAYMMGFHHLGLLPGAEKLPAFKKETESSVIGMINRARRPQDVEILARIHPKSDAVKKAADKKLADFVK